MIYAARAASFLYAFSVLAFVAWQRDFNGWLWSALVLQFLVYPHVAYLDARRAQSPREAEFRHMLLEALLLGGWFAVFGFAEWIGLGLLLSTSLNGMAYRGVAGFGKCLLLFVLGALAVGAANGFHYQPQLAFGVMVFAVVGALIYAWLIGYIVWVRSRRLAAVREELLRSEARYRLITENVADLVTMVDADCRWVYAGPSFERYLDAADLAPGKDCSASLVQPDREQLVLAVRAAIRDGSRFELRVRLIAKDGTSHLLKVAGRPVPDGDGERRHAVLVAQDITEIANQQERLDLAAHAFAEMGEAIMIHAADGTIVMVNHAYTALTGYAAEEVIGRPERVFRAAVQTNSFYDNMYEAAAQDGRWTGSTWSRRKNGTLYREWRNVSVIRDAAGSVSFYVTLFFELDSREAPTATVAQLMRHR
jgi:PAS domain S-box-containing protein